MLPKVYCDLDEVLADFKGGWKEFTGQDVDRWLKITSDDWGYLKKQWPTFWMDLEFVPFALELWKAIAPYDPDILTARPESWVTASVGKSVWVREYLSGAPKVICVMRSEKKNYAKQKDGTPNILIDDKERNITEWAAAGGRGIQYIPSSSAVSRVVRIIEAHMAQYGD